MSKRKAPGQLTTGDPKRLRLATLVYCPQCDCNLLENDVDAHRKTHESSQNTRSSQPSSVAPMDLDSENPRFEGLSYEQRQVAAAILAGRSVFFTGSAGVGKSHLTNFVCKKLLDPATTAVTGSTGIAAINVGGLTIHSWAGIGLGTSEVYELVGKIFRSKKHLMRWSFVKTLVIDEISMISAELFDKLEAIARRVRKNDLPFG